MSTKVRGKHFKILFPPAEPILSTRSGNYIHVFCLTGVDRKLFSNELDIYKAIHVSLYAKIQANYRRLIIMK